MAGSTHNNSSKNHKTRKNPAKWAAILKAAESIFAKKGFHEATISAIAKKSKVSEATIYEYFSSKEELLFSIPAQTTLQYEEKSREILKYIPGAANKLRFLVHSHLGLYAENPDYANIVMLILKGHRNFQKTEAYKIVQSAARKTIRVLEEGMQNGEFRPGIQPHLVRAILWGTVEHLVTRKCLLGKPDDLVGLADEIIETIFQGIVVPQKEPTINLSVKIEDNLKPKGGRS
ncbi:MAG: TetR/AcrR family transcriptional regulator [Desulfobacterales bacterium]|jgi:TetR/AcrR family fatty acid metabolism transcriptional regulator